MYFRHPNPKVLMRLMLLSLVLPYACGDDFECTCHELVNELRDETIAPRGCTFWLINDDLCPTTIADPDDFLDGVCVLSSGSAHHSCAAQAQCVNDEIEEWKQENCRYDEVSEEYDCDLEDLIQVENCAAICQSYELDPERLSIQLQGRGYGDEFNDEEPDFWDVDNNNPTGPFVGCMDNYCAQCEIFANHLGYFDGTEDDFWCGSTPIRFIPENDCRISASTVASNNNLAIDSSEDGDDTDSLETVIIIVGVLLAVIIILAVIILRRKSRDRTPPALAGIQMVPIGKIEPNILQNAHPHTLDPNMYIPNSRSLAQPGFSPPLQYSISSPSGPPPMPQYETIQQYNRHEYEVLNEPGHEVLPRAYAEILPDSRSPAIPPQFYSSAVNPGHVNSFGDHVAAQESTSEPTTFYSSASPSSSTSNLPGFYSSASRSPNPSRENSQRIAIRAAGDYDSFGQRSVPSSSIDKTEGEYDGFGNSGEINTSAGRMDGSENSSHANLSANKTDGGYDSFGNCSQPTAGNVNSDYDSFGLESRSNTELPIRALTE